MSWLTFPGSELVATWVTRALLAVGDSESQARVMLTGGGAYTQDVSLQGGGLAAVGLGALYCFQEKLVGLLATCLL